MYISSLDSSLAAGSISFTLKDNTFVFGLLSIKLLRISGVKTDELWHATIKVRVLSRKLQYTILGTYSLLLVKVSS